MAQNIISLTLSDAQLATVDQALTDIENQLTGLIALTTDQRRKLNKMGEKSEAFCRQSIALLEQNPQVIPSTMDVADAVADLQTMDRLRPRILRLQRLSERASDTDLALGSDVMAAALQGYALLKVVGKNQGLETSRKELGLRFSKTPRQTEVKAA